jgi:polyhydroxyalkanoate synthesis regulator phasin
VDEDLPVGWWAQRLKGARADAARIAAELVAHGHLSDDQAAALEHAVGSAIASGRELLTEALREPARLVEVLRRSAAAARAGGRDSAADVASVEERLERLDERVARLEAALARMGIDAGASDAVASDAAD